MSGKIILEVMTHCEAEVITKEISAQNTGELKKLLEQMRKNKFQSVAWLDDKYLGGTWFNVNTYQWTAELLDEVWSD
ncbi:MAG: hypothetical protein Q9M37_02120 [Desulfonauticus sp.]|nr:hypothetical protein [Desulfonauticus sp.]